MNGIKNYDFQVKALNQEGYFTAIAAVFNEVDRDNDRIKKGSFAKTIRENPQIPLLWAHDVKEPVGMVEEMKETNRGLEIKARLAINTKEGSRAYNLLKFNPNVLSLSIGFSGARGNYIRENGKSIREITHINKLWEISLVVFPAQPNARILDVKGNNALSYNDTRQELLNIKHEVKQKVAEYKKQLKDQDKRIIEFGRKLRQIESEISSFQIKMICDRIIENLKKLDEELDD